MIPVIITGEGTIEIWNFDNDIFTEPSGDISDDLRERKICILLKFDHFVNIDCYVAERFMIAFKSQYDMFVTDRSSELFNSFIEHDYSDMNCIFDEYVSNTNLEINYYENDNWIKYDIQNCYETFKLMAIDYIEN